MQDLFANDQSSSSSSTGTNVASAGVAAARSSTGQSRTKRINNITAFALVSVVILAAVPFGSNRPFFWALWAFVIGSSGLIYFAMLLRHSGTLRRPIALYPVISCLFVTVAFWMSIQSIPLSAIWSGAEFKTQTGEVVFSPSLSIAPGDTLLALLKWVTYGTLFFLFLQVSARKTRARNLSLTLMFAVTIFALYSFFSLHYLGDTLLFSDKVQYFGDATGTFVNRNSFATFLAMGAALSAGLAMPTVSAKSESRSDRNGQISKFLNFTSVNAIALACLAIIVSSMIATNSRMGVFAGITGIFVVVLLRLPNNRQRMAAAIAALVACVLVLFFFGSELLDRLLFTARGANSRLEIYQQVLSMVADRPLLGFGADAFRLGFPLYQAPPVSSDLVFDKAHSTYLTHWSELGVFVGTLPILIVATIALMIIRHMRKTGSRTVEVCASLGTIAVAAVHSIVDFSLEIQAVVFLFLAILALGFSEALSDETKS